jgi:hypothetical protein
MHDADPQRATTTSCLFRFFVVLLNPKTTLFFAAFLPQFLTPGAPPIVQSLLLGTMFVLIAGVSDSAYALLASAVTSRLGHSDGFRRAGVWLGAAIYIGLGIITALTGVRSADQTGGSFARVRDTAIMMPRPPTIRHAMTTWETPLATVASRVRCSKCDVRGECDLTAMNHAKPRGYRTEH